MLLENLLFLSHPFQIGQNFVDHIVFKMEGGHLTIGSHLRWIFHQLPQGLSIPVFDHGERAIEFGTHDSTYSIDGMADGAALFELSAALHDGMFLGEIFGGGL